MAQIKDLAVKSLKENLWSLKIKFFIIQIKDLGCKDYKGGFYGKGKICA